MDEKKRIEEIKEGLKKSVYQEAARIKVSEDNNLDSTEKLSNILEGYMERIDTIEADNMEELEEELRVLKSQNVEVGSVEERDSLVKEYNDYIHNDLERTIAETIEYTHNLNNHTDDLNDILIRPMADERYSDGIEVNRIDSNEEEIIPSIYQEKEAGKQSSVTDELFEIEATTELGVMEDIVELEEDTMDIEEPADEIKSDDKELKITKEKENKFSKVSEDPYKGDEFEDDKGLGAIDYALIAIAIVVFIVLVGLVIKINGVF